MQITVKGKELITTQIEALLVKGENNADVIEITMPTTYEGVLISDKRFVIKAVNAAGVYYEEILEKVIEGDIIKLTWVVTSPFTTVDGALIIALSVEDDEGYNLSTYTAKLMVAKSVTPMIALAPEAIFEDYLQEMRMRTDQAEDYSFIAEAAKTEALASKLAAETAKTGAEAARDAAALSQADALTSKNAAAASQSAAETARTGAEAARDIAVTAADDAVVRMAAYEGGAIAVQVEHNSSAIGQIDSDLDTHKADMSQLFVRARNQLAQSIPSGVWTKLVFNMVDNTHPDMFTPSASETAVTIAKSGVYLISGIISFNQPDAGGIGGIRVLLNGEDNVASATQYLAVGFGVDVIVTTQLYLDASDTIELQAYQSTGFALNSVSSHPGKSVPQFIVKKVG